MPSSLNRNSTSTAATNQTQRPSTTTPTLFHLPPELLHHIYTYLPLPSRLALQHLSHRSHASFPPPTPSTKPPPCDRLALSRVNEANALLRSGKRRCVLCGTPRTLDHFRNDGTPVCDFHDGWFASSTVPGHLEPALQDRVRALAAAGEETPRWVALPRTYSAHDGEIWGWTAPVPLASGGGGCEVCGVWAVECYVRVPECENFGLEREFVVDGQGKVVGVLEQSRGRAGWRRVPVVRLEEVAGKGRRESLVGSGSRGLVEAG